MTEADDADETPEPAEPGNGSSVPEVELGLYQVSVRVKGRDEDGLDDVAGTARELVDHLIDRAEVLEDDPDERGLG